MADERWRDTYDDWKTTEPDWGEPDDCPHEWIYTGTAYSGDDDRWCGEGRVYCALCGMDGDG